MFSIFSLVSRVHRIKTLIDTLSKLSIGEYLLMPNIDDEVLLIVKQKGDSSTEDGEDVSEHKQNLWESRSRTVG
jgi:hypothetical protein